MFLFAKVSKLLYCLSAAGSGKSWQFSLIRDHKNAQVINYIPARLKCLKSKKNAILTPLINWESYLHLQGFANFIECIDTRRQHSVLDFPDMHRVIPAAFASLYWLRPLLFLDAFTSSPIVFDSSCFSINIVFCSGDFRPQPLCYLLRMYFAAASAFAAACTINFLSFFNTLSQP